MVSTQDSESCDPGSNPGRTSFYPQQYDTLAEWLRRVIRNHMGFPRGSSNLSGVVFENFVEAQVTVMCKVSMTSLQLFELFELFLEANKSIQSVHTTIVTSPLSSDGRAFAF